MIKLLFSKLFAVCLVVIGIFFMVAGHKNAAKFAALRDHGKTAAATIVKLDWKEKKASHLDDQYTAHVRFTTDDGRQVQTEVHVPTDQGRAIRSNMAPSAMTVRYLPEAPTTLYDVNKDDDSDAQVGGGRLMALIGAGMLAVHFLLGRRRRR